MAVENENFVNSFLKIFQIFSANQFQCTVSKKCIGKRLLCDGKGDCDDVSDETVKQCGLNL